MCLPIADKRSVSASEVRSEHGVMQSPVPLFSAGDVQKNKNVLLNNDLLPEKIDLLLEHENFIHVIVARVYCSDMGTGGRSRRASK